MLESAGMRAVCRALRRSRAPLQLVDLSMNDAASFAAPAIARLLVAKRRTLVTGTRLGERQSSIINRREEYSGIICQQNLRWHVLATTCNNTKYRIECH
jgi:hypothetical protein